MIVLPILFYEVWRGLGRWPGSNDECYDGEDGSSEDGWEFSFNDKMVGTMRDNWMRQSDGQVNLP